ncbi:acyl-CoA dehydrogenase family protein [Granulosicoccaceae sp. 1_MG-2023]|nr:acyl-CoA dehydrogenase family protein [Granulosicoccaceae sp. 1_MG-2023]
MDETDRIVLDTAERLFSECCDAELVNRAGDGEVPGALMKAVLESGLPLAWVAEEAGGVGGSLALGFNLIRQTGGFALPVPLAETLVANLLLGQAGLALGEGWTGLAYDGGSLPVAADGRVSGVVEGACGVVEAELLVVPVLRDGAVAIAGFEPEAVTARHYRNPAGEARTKLVFDEAVPLCLSAPLTAMSESGLYQFCALVRAAQIAGALDKIVALTVGYVKERQQFGRPLAKFQAIQHKVAEIAGEAALSGASVEQAVRLLSAHGQPFADDPALFRALATAKLLASEAAGPVAREAHQAHGAMGFSFEYPLQQYSRRVWSWREEFGSEFYWSSQLGMAVACGISSGATAKVWDFVSP